MIASVFAHGIPQRTFFAGSVNAAVIVGTALLEGTGTASLPVAPLVRGYALPLVFGLLPQTVAYRQAMKRHVGERGHRWP